MSDVHGTSQAPPARGPHLTDALGQVDFFQGLDEETLLDIASRGRRQHFRGGAAIVSELEPGADVYVLLEGEAEVSVVATDGQRQVLGTMTPGRAFGELASLTGELRSATVTATSDVTVLVLSDAEFDHLRARRPEIAVALVRIIAGRLGEAEHAIEALFDPARVSAATPAASVVDKTSGRRREGRRGSVRRVWNELVIAKKRDLGFLALAAFVTTLIAVRLTVYLSFRFDVAPRGILRMAYMTGFTSLIASACASLLTFRPALRRVIAVLYGVGIALIFNELGVTLAFDIFYKDIHTPDPNVPFDVEALYRRTEPLRFIAIGLVVLVQLAYLRKFYSRAAFVLRTRLRGLLSRSAKA